jgi:hypothetical protein
VLARPETSRLCETYREIVQLFKEQGIVALQAFDFPIQVMGFVSSSVSVSWKHNIWVRPVPNCGSALQLLIVVKVADDIDAD